MKPGVNPDILRRSFVAYLIVFLIIKCSADFKAMEHLHARFLFWRLASGQFTNYRDGVVYYEMVTRLDPYDAEAFANLGVCYYKLNEQAKAVEAYERAVRLDPKYNLDSVPQK